MVSVGAIVVPGSTTLTTTVFAGFTRSIGVVVVVVVPVVGLATRVVVVLVEVVEVANVSVDQVSTLGLVAVRRRFIG